MADSELGLKGKGVEREVIKELDEAMADLISNRDKRMKFGRQEKEAGAIVVGLYKKHKLKAYQYDDKVYDLKQVEKVVVHKDDDDGE